jgi:hypothetical protein
VLPQTPPLRWVLLLAEGAGLSTILCPAPEAAVVPAGGCCGFVYGGRSVVGVAASGAWRAVSEAIVTVSGAGGTVPGTEATVAGAGAVPLSVKSLHPPRQFFSALHELGAVRWLANARERRPGDGLGDTVRIVGRSVELNLRMASESGLDVVG